jgi:hypothetical protein
MSSYKRTTAHSKRFVRFSLLRRLEMLGIWTVREHVYWHLSETLAKWKEEDAHYLWRSDFFNTQQRDDYSPLTRNVIHFFCGVLQDSMGHQRTWDQSNKRYNLNLTPIFLDRSTFCANAWTCFCTKLNELLFNKSNLLLFVFCFFVFQ